MPIISTVGSQINVSHIKDISQINNVVDADQISIYYINASQINDNLTLTIDLPLTNNIVNLRFDCILFWGGGVSIAGPVHQF